ncbi:MAG: PIN domain-containing protein [Syntrophales bacterium]|nr:PIN domain-containing protein [Syntrophales bacterium]
MLTKPGIAMTTNNAVFVDTSAFYALMDSSDKHHAEAEALWTSLIEENFQLLTTNYVVLETVPLLRNRLGFDASSLWYRDILGVVKVLWTDEYLHRLAFELWLSLGKRRLSLVDCVSFVAMRQHQSVMAFCFDGHFADEGFEIMSI